MGTGYVKAFPLGRVRGKIALNDDQTFKTFGFHLKEGAIGVMLRVYTMKNGKKGLFVNNCVPASNPNTLKQRLWRLAFKLAVLQARSMSGDYHENMKTITRYYSYYIYPIIKSLP